MKDSVFPGDTMVFRGEVIGVETDDVGCGWATLNVTLSVGDKTVNTECTARVAIPQRRGRQPVEARAVEAP